MHSFIVEIDWTPIIKEHKEWRISIHSMDDYCEGLNIDYVSTTPEDERLSIMKHVFEECFPNGMFSVLNEDEVKYNGGVEILAENAIKMVRDYLSKVDEKNWFADVNAWKAKNIFTDPLECNLLFSIYKHPRSTADFLHSLTKIHEGDIIYIGGILDYHY